MNKIIVTLTYIPISIHDKKKSQKYFLQSIDTLFLKNINAYILII